MKKHTQLSNNTTQFVDLDNARVDEQRDVMKEILNQEHCPFCMENLKKYHKKPILKETKHWLVTENQWPYDNVKMQLLLIYKTHAERLQDLDPEAGKELFEIVTELEKEHHIPGGAFAMRFGDTEHSAGTVLHIHAQFIWPDIDKPGFQPVRFKIGKNPEDRQK